MLNNSFGLNALEKFVRALLAGRRFSPAISLCQFIGSKGLNLVQEILSTDCRSCDWNNEYINTFFDQTICELVASRLFQRSWNKTANSIVNRVSLPQCNENNQISDLNKEKELNCRKFIQLLIVDEFQTNLQTEKLIHF